MESDSAANTSRREDSGAASGTISADAVLEQIRAGGAAAAALICERFLVDIDRTLWRLLGADNEHQDLAHEVLCAVLKGAKQVRDADALAGWVRRVTANVVYSELRKRNVRRRWSSLEPDPERFAAEGAGPVVTRRLGRIYDILDRLPARGRMVLSLRYFEGYSIEEIAQTLDCSTRTVNRRLARASDRFKRLAAADAELCTWLDEMQDGRRAP